MKRVEHLLRREIGLDAASIGSPLIERVVRQRMSELGLTELEDYERLLQSSPSEWNGLVESVVVTETWFFRDESPFAVFVRLAQEEWRPAHPAGALRVLSVPCASGEEPYSLAMSLLDAGWALDKFQIDAIDISRRALERAKRAVYGRNSFRGKNLAFRDRHFRKTSQGYVLESPARRNVRFSAGNFLADDFRTGNGVYDFVFCRNLLIYFDRATQKRAFEKLHRLLSPEGVLFLGPAEVPLAAECGFACADLPMAFACRKVTTGSAKRTGPERLPARSGKLAPTPAAPPSGSPESSVPVNRQTQTLTRDALAESPLADLEAARRLADAGRLDEAAEICRAHLRHYGASAPAYYLLGLVHEARGQPQAVECYRKTLYLEPSHRDALQQLALLAEKHGDLLQAKALRRRAQRAQLNAELNRE